MTEIVLQLKDVKVAYGGIQAVKSVNLEIQKGELVTLIGANGAGKTTTMKAITGLLSPQSGQVSYMGQDITKLRADQRVRQGLVMVPEGRGVFTRMTIVENLMMGAYLRNDQAEIQRDIEHMFEIFPRLKERAKQLAGTMSGGEQQMLAMARALMTKPKLLLLDEPSMGLSPIMVEKIFEVVRRISSEGVTLLLVEQNAKLALEAANRGYVMDSGEIILAGEASKLLTDPAVRAAYLGEEPA